MLGIQASTGETVQTIAQIGAAIQRVNDPSRSIAAAVEQQNGATREVGGRMQSLAGELQSLVVQFNA